MRDKQEPEHQGVKVSQLSPIDPRQYLGSGLEGEVGRLAQHPPRHRGDENIVRGCQSFQRPDIRLAIVAGEFVQPLGAVEKYLEEHLEINRDYAYDIGLPACGRIKNLGGRVHELRKAGWDIKTDVRHGVCWYVLVSRPQARTKSLGV